MRHSRNRALFLLLVAAGCARRSEAPRDATRQMVDTLAALYRRAEADPMRYPYLNVRRAAVMDSALTREPRLASLRNRFLLAQERLRANQNRQAIQDLEQIIRDAGYSPDGERITAGGEASLRSSCHGVPAAGRTGKLYR